MSTVPQQPPEDQAEQSAAGAPQLPADHTAQQPAGPAPQPKTNRGVGQVYLLVILSTLFAGAVGGPLLHRSRFAGLAVIETLLLVAAVVYVRLKGLPVAVALQWRPISLSSALLSVALGASACGIAVGIGLLTMAVLGPIPNDEGELLKVVTGPQLAVMLICGALLPGICEETLFRGAIQGTLLRRGPVKAVLITALLFALVHFSRWNFLPPLFYGVVFGIVTLRTRSTLPAMIAHTTTNATIFTIEYLAPGENSLPVLLLCGVLATGFLVGFPIYLARTRQQVSRPGLLASVPAGLSWWFFAALAAIVGLFFALMILGAALG